MKTELLVRKLHRACGLLFLITIPPAFYFSMAGNSSSPFVYFPLLPLLCLAVSGSYMLVKPWIRKETKPAR